MRIFRMRRRSERLPPPKATSEILAELEPHLDEIRRLARLMNARAKISQEETKALQAATVALEAARKGEGDALA
jgi:hypothetical protein